MSFRAARQALLARSDLHGDAFCSALSAAADEWLQGLFAAAAGGNESGVALLAVGGYGRGELCPFSDLDVVLVHLNRRDIGTVADALWYPVWDEGIRLDHSVRRPKEVLAVAADDLRAQLGLLDGRLVAGDASVVVPLLAEALALWRRRAPAQLPLLAQQGAARRAEHGDVAFLLEPDVKEAHGGLRDVNAVGAVAHARSTLSEHVDLEAIEQPRQVLTAARVELHRLTNRATDRLLLQEQDAVGAALGYSDADALMAAVAEAGRTVAWVVDDVWRRRSLWQGGRGGPIRRLVRSPRQELDEALHRGLEPVEDGVAIATEGGTPAEVVLARHARVAEDVTLPLRLAAVAAERGLPLGRTALALLSERSPSPPDPWPDTLRQSFVRVLSAGPPAITALEALDQRQLLVRALPEWQAVRNRPQRNAYHRFTVDRHLLETAAHAASVSSRVSRPDLLLVGALLHDIGKGFAGDHTEVGVEVVGRVVRRMGFSEADTATLVSMVRNHLLLPDAATRRDLDDPVTIATVAEAVGDAATLELLGALAEADGTATGPAAWGPWKAGLVAELVRRVHAHLAGAAPAAVPSSITDRHRALMRQAERLGRTVVAADTPTVTVVSRDRPGLLAAVTGVLALQGLDVRSADVAGEDTFAVEVFVVEPSRGRWPDWQQVGDEIDAVLRGTLPLAERLSEQDRLYGRRRPAAAHPAEASVAVDNEASATSTVIEIRAPDRAGLLHDVTSALFGQDLDVTTARVSTLGEDVVDAFYVRDRDAGGKVTDAGRLAGIEAAVRTALERREPGGP